MTTDRFTLPAPVPGLGITLMTDRMPFAIAKAVGWEGEKEHGRLRLDNGLVVQIRPLDDIQILVGGWYVERSRTLPGHIMARPALEGDEVLVQAISGRKTDTNPYAPIKVGSSGMRLADWSRPFPPTTSILSMLPILADLLVGADDPDELSVGSTTLHAYMNRRFGPPNVSYDPSDMPYGAWLFETPLDDMMVWVAPYDILPLQIRAFVTDETNLVLRKAWDDCLVSFYRDRDPVGASVFAEVVSPYCQVLRDVMLDLMRPVAFRDDAIDPFGPMNEWRPARAANASRTPRVLKPHPMSTLALPPSVTAQPDLFVDLCRLISTSNDGAKATLERLVAQLQSGA